MTETKQQVVDELIKDDYEMAHALGMGYDGGAYWRDRYEQAIDVSHDQTSCPFCHLPSKTAAEWRNDIWGVQAYLLGHKLSIYIRGQIDSLSISFCPMCGRRLC